MAAENGNNVKVHYTGKLQDGTVFDSSEGRDPLAFTLGAGQMIVGFEKAVLGMSVGDKTTAEIPATEAYGERNEQLIMPFPKDKFPKDMEVSVGMPLTMQNQDGQPIPVTVVEIKETEIMLDANHQLAGKDLIFDIEVVEIA